MIDKANAWARRWGPLIALLGVFLGGLALVVEDGKELTEKTTNKPKEVVPAVVVTAPDTVGKVPEILPLTTSSLHKNYNEYNVYGIQADCVYLIKKEPPAGLAAEQQSAVKRYCLTGSSRSIFVNHFSSSVRGRELEILSRSAEMLNIANARPVIAINELDNCEVSDQEDASAVFASSWLSIALKAFWLADAGGQGGKVSEALKAGSEPFESLPGQVVPGEIPKVQYLSRSLQILSTYQIDQFLKLYSDEDILKFSAIVLQLMPENLEKAALRSAKSHLKRYPAFKERSANRQAVFERLFGESRYIEVNSGKIVGTSPQGAVYSSCPEDHIDRFWFRRLLNGTDERFAKLAEQLVASSGQETDR